MWRVIVELLESKIAGVVTMLPIPLFDVKVWEMKAFEDQLDAVVCARVAIEVLEGRALPYGDEVSAAWIPKRTPLHDRFSNRWKFKVLR